MSESQQHQDYDLGNGLRLLRSHLQIVHDGIVVAAAVLHRQNADRDQEVARVLEHLVGERLVDQIERVSRLLAVMEARGYHPIRIDGGGTDEGGAPQGVRESKLLPLWRPKDPMKHAYPCT